MNRQTAKVGALSSSMALHSMVFPRNYGPPERDEVLVGGIEREVSPRGLSSATPTLTEMMVAGTGDVEQLAEIADFPGYWVLK